MTYSELVMECDKVAWNSNVVSQVSRTGSSLKLLLALYNQQEYKQDQKKVDP